MDTKRIECQGVVLASMPYGESDKIIRLYTERAGKLFVLVKGAKSRRSATVALSETFTFGLYRLGAGKSFYYLNSGKILQANMGLRKNYDALVYASALVEIVDKSSVEAPLPVFLGFLIKYLSFMGYRPMMPETDEGSYVFLTGSGVVEADGAHGGCPLNDEDIYTFRHLLYTPLDKINLSHVLPSTLEKIYGLMKVYAVDNLQLDNIQSLQLRM